MTFFLSPNRYAVLAISFCMILSEVSPLLQFFSVLFRCSVRNTYRRGESNSGGKIFKMEVLYPRSNFFCECNCNRLRSVRQEYRKFVPSFPIGITESFSATGEESMYGR